MKSITGAIVCLFIGHRCPLESLKNTGKGDDSNERVMAICGRCGKVLTAHCGLAMRTEWYRLRPLNAPRERCAVAHTLNGVVGSSEVPK